MFPEMNLSISQDENLQERKSNFQTIFCDEVLQTQYNLLQTRKLK